MVKWRVDHVVDKGRARLRCNCGCRAGSGRLGLGFDKWRWCLREGKREFIRRYVKRKEYLSHQEGCGASASEV